MWTLALTLIKTLNPNPEPVTHRAVSKDDGSSSSTVSRLTSRCSTPSAWSACGAWGRGQHQQGSASAGGEVTAGSDPVRAAIHLNGMGKGGKRAGWLQRQKWPSNDLHPTRTDVLRPWPWSPPPKWPQSYGALRLTVQTQRSGLVCRLDVFMLKGVMMADLQAKRGADDDVPHGVLVDSPAERTERGEQGDAADAAAA